MATDRSRLDSSPRRTAKRSRELRRLALSAVLVGAATVGFFVAPPLVLLGVAAVTIYITLIRPRGARGRTAGVAGRG